MSPPASGSVGAAGREGPRAGRDVRAAAVRRRDDRRVHRRRDGVRRRTAAVHPAVAAHRPEAFALLAAGRAALAAPRPPTTATAPSDRALAKLVDSARRGRHVGGGRHAAPPLAAASPRRSRPAAELRDRATGRRIRDEPASARSHRGRCSSTAASWYVIADDERSGEQRTFRIDRIESLEPTGEHRRARRGATLPRAGRGSPTARRARA